jgi:hypothetical protein
VALQNPFSAEELEQSRWHWTFIGEWLKQGALRLPPVCRVEYGSTHSLLTWFPQVSAILVTVCKSVAFGRFFAGVARHCGFCEDSVGVLVGVAATASGSLACLAGVVGAADGLLDVALDAVRNSDVGACSYRRSHER